MSARPSISGLLGARVRVFCSWLGGMGDMGCFFGEKDRERVAFVRGYVDIWLGRGPLRARPDVSMGTMPAACGSCCSLGYDRSAEGSCSL